MRHGLKTAVVDLHGVNRTEITGLPHGGKNIDVLSERLANSIENNKLDPELPTFPRFCNSVRCHRMEIP